jgi:SAM-dependent methyltransferase
MIARRAMPEEHRRWNHRWGAPFGRSLWRFSCRLPRGTGVMERTLFTLLPELRGPFSFQPNNTTRVAEYPLAFFAQPVVPGLRVLEIGGGLSGFQFVLDRCGCEVVNVDPGMKAHGRGFFVNETSIARLNRAFRTNVTLHHCFLQDARLQDASFDRIYSISVIEHIPVAEIPGIMRRAYALLKPGGTFIITLDLFLNVAPFAAANSNEYGVNVSARMLAESAPFDLIVGDKTELFGFTEFSKDTVISRMDAYFVGAYPALAQFMVLRKSL